jgi:hypothetical protein
MSEQADPRPTYDNKESSERTNTPAALSRRGWLRAAWLAASVASLPGCGGGGGGGGDSPAPAPGPPAPPPSGGNPPGILDFTPTAGGPGSEVTINGINFAVNAAGNTVTFNGMVATVLSATAMQIVAVVPSGATSGPIRVSTAGGSAQTAASFSVLAASAFTTRVLAPRVEGGLAWNGSLLVSVGSSISTSTDAAPQHWDERAALVNLDDVAFAAGLFVAVGFAGIRTSSDGLTWTPRAEPSGLPGDLSAVAGNGSIWVAVGERGGIATSPEGVTWTARTSNTTSTLRRIVWSGSHFVAAGEAGVLMTSPDGIEWTLRSAGVTDTFVALGSDGNLIVAATAASNNSPSRILTSTDGVAWSIRATNLGYFEGIGRAPNGGRWVAVGSYRVAWSDDGLTWTGADLPHAWPRRVVHTGNRFVALGIVGSSEPAVWTSVDGQVWTMRAAALRGRALARSPQGRIVSVPLGDRSAASTDQGTTWSYGTSVSSGGINLFLDVVWSDALAKFAAVVQVAANQYLYTSADGLAWTAGAYVPFNGRLGASPTLLVAVGGSLVGNGLATSPDGLNWTTRTLPVTTSLHDVAWLGGTRFVAVGAQGVILTSNDGASWTQRSGSSGAATLRAAAAGTARWVVVGESGTVLTSDDAGATWTPRTSGTSVSLLSVEWTGAAFVAVGSSGHVFRSADGIAWSPVAAPYQSVPFGSDPLNLEAELWLDDRLLIAGPRGLLATAVL